MDALVSIPDGAQTSDTPVFAARYSFIAGLGSFILLLVFCRHNGSNWGIGSAKKAISALRGAITVQLVCLVILLYFYLENGGAITLHSALIFPNGQNWIYGYGRPVAGMIFFSSGLFADMHPFLRYSCICGSLVQILGDTLSAYQIYDYKNQVSRLNAPNNGYTLHELTIYYWRDLISIALSTLILLQTLYLLAMLGFFLPQLIHPSAISGSFYNRFEVMHLGRSKRKFMESNDIIFSPPPPLVPRKTLQMKIEEQFHQRQQEQASPTPNLSVALDQKEEA